MDAIVGNAVRIRKDVHLLRDVRISASQIGGGIGQNIDIGHACITITFVDGNGNIRVGTSILSCLEIGIRVDPIGLEHNARDDIARRGKRINEAEGLALQVGEGLNARSLRWQ